MLFFHYYPLIRSRASSNIRFHVLLISKILLTKNVKPSLFCCLNQYIFVLKLQWGIIKYIPLFCWLCKNYFFLWCKVEFSSTGNRKCKKSLYMNVSCHRENIKWAVISPTRPPSLHAGLYGEFSFCSVIIAERAHCMRKQKWALTPKLGNESFSKHMILFDACVTGNETFLFWGTTYKQLNFG